MKSLNQMLEVLDNRSSNYRGSACGVGQPKILMLHCVDHVLWKLCLLNEQTSLFSQS